MALQRYPQILWAWYRPVDMRVSPSQMASESPSSPPGPGGGPASADAPDDACAREDATALPGAAQREWRRGGRNN